MRRVALVLALMPACTTDFFVGPDLSATSGGADDVPAETDAADPSTTGTPPPGTTGDSTPEDPTQTQETDTNDSTGGDEDPTRTGRPDPVTAGEEETGGETSDDPCAVEDEKSCFEAGPACTWDGRICTGNPCNAEGVKACQAFGDACLWTGKACIENPCGSDECSDLPVDDCIGTPGCVAVEEFCALELCVPCEEVFDLKLCNALPLCEYNELEEACMG